MFHAGGVEGRAPAELVVLRQLQVVALTVHARADVADSGQKEGEGSSVTRLEIDDAEAAPNPERNSVPTRLETRRRRVTA